MNTMTTVPQSKYTYLVTALGVGLMAVSELKGKRSCPVERIMRTIQAKQTRLAGSSSSHPDLPGLLIAQDFRRRVMQKPVKRVRER